MKRTVIVSPAAPPVPQQELNDLFCRWVTGGDLVGYYNRALEYQRAKDKMREEKNEQQ